MKCLSKKTVNLECYHIVFFEVISRVKWQYAILAQEISIKHPPTSNPSLMERCGMLSMLGFGRSPSPGVVQQHSNFNSQHGEFGIKQMHPSHLQGKGAFQREGRVGNER